MIKVLIAGDFCPNSRVSQLIEDGQYDQVFGNYKSLTDEADYSIVNFECPVVINTASPINKLGPNLKCSYKAVAALKYAGVDLVTLANNHVYDYGDVGVKDTITTLLEYNIDMVGAGENLTQAQQILYKNINGETFAFINFCEHEFSIATDSSGGANPLNPISNYYQIQEARQNAKYVILIVHGGHEHYQLPSPRMKETYRFFIDAGADVVLNHHQHYYSGYEVYKGKPIFYGLGNFCFDWPDRRNSLWNEGYVVELQFGENIFNFLLHHFNQGNEDVSINMMNDEQIEKNNAAIVRLNSIIAIDTQLIQEHKKWIIENQMIYKLALEPYQNRYLAALYLKHLLPSFLSKTKLLRMQNYLECESHIERMLNFIKHELNNK